MAEQTSRHDVGQACPKAAQAAVGLKDPETAQHFIFSLVFGWFRFRFASVSLGMSMFH
jgi:hypothetical protein